MSVLSHTRALILVACPLVLARAGFAQIEGVGFQARLEMRSTVVSPFDEPEDEFSAAIRPLSYAALSKRFLFTPKIADQGSFESNALSFSTRIRGDVELVPVSVDARQYHHQRVRNSVDREWGGFASNTITQGKQKGQRDGLSIGMDLPKRFDQMFGEGGANLRVSGNYRITFSGRSQWDDAARSGIRKQSKFPALNMEQVSRFTIQGTIGTKISVSVSQDNQTDIPLANRLILRYKGDEDDIVKTIEAGNTTLNIPTTQFVGYSQHIQGLFGLKTEAQLGNLKLTAIASQEKGSSESATVSASGEENAEYIRDHAYLQGRIFDLAYPDEIGIYDSVKVWVYEEEPNQLSTSAEWMYLKTGEESSSLDVALFMTEIPREQFELLYGQNPVYCPVALVFYSTRQRPIGVRMEIKRFSSASVATGEVTTIGYTGEGMDTLRIIQPESEDNLPTHPAWKLMWRNCYRIPQNIKIDDIDVKIRKGLPGREEIASNLDYQEVDGVSQDPYIKILGLDQWNNNREGVKTPDGKLDPYDDVFRSDWGMLIFPDRKPFDTNRVFIDASNNASDTLLERVPSLYFYNSYLERTEASKYYIQISTKTRSATIRLGRANVIEGSERVTLNGRQLTKGTEYDISYDMGQVTLLTDEATSPNADVQVQFQYAPFMALQKKTLLGVRAEYAHSEDLKFGSTVLYKSDKAQERKPRVGQETAKATVVDFDVSFGLTPRFLTNLIDALPLISTEADSRIRVTAEVAQSLPNPNVDGNAYIDDFESAVELQSLGNVRTNWTLASTPLDIKSSTDPWTRGTIRWHNPPPISREEVYKTETVAGQGALHPLRLIFRPHGYKFTGPAETPCSDSVASASWGGIMRSFANRVDGKRVQVFEVRAKGGKGTLHFDFGRISEDINGNENFDTEDQSYPANSTLDDGEDTGLDRKMDAGETDACGRTFDADTLPDPAGDNWWYEFKGKGVGADNARPPIPLDVWNSPGFQDNVNNIDHWLHYEWQNGTEGNIDDDAVQGLPDEEALGGSFRKINAYFTFELPLNTDANNPFLVPETEFNDWYTYRVPVREPEILDTIAEGDEVVSWSNVTHVRVWFEQDSTGVDSLGGMDSVLIADWGFVQSNWRDTLKVLPADTTSKFYITSVSEENGSFVAPPGVEPYVDKINNITEAQRGMSLVFDSLQPGAEGIAKKELLTAESYSGYRRMEMYVYCVPYLSPEASLMFYFRLGLDTNNYYEFRTPLKPGWDRNNYVNIVFDSITALKDRADRSLEDRRARLEDSTDVYRVVGRPNINEVKFLSASVRNTGNTIIDSGAVWLDELRVTEVRRDAGTAARVLVNGSLADLASYGFTYEHRDAFFRGLSQATRGGSRDNLGSGQETNNLSINGALDIGRFLPRSWTAKMPVSYAYSEAVSTPLLRSKSDVVLPPETREAEKSITRSVKVSVSESFLHKGGNLIFNALLNRQKVAFSYNRTRMQTVTNPYIFSENYNIRADFDMGVSKPPEVPIFFWTSKVPVLKKASKSKLSFYPSRWAWNATFNRNLSTRDDVDLNRTSSFSRTLDGRMDVALRIFPTLNVTYNMTTKRDLTDPSLVNIAFRDFKLGLENSYSQAFQFSYDPKLFSFLSGAFAYTANYSDNYDKRTKSLAATLSKSWSISGDFKHQALLDMGRKQGAGRSGASAGTARGGRAEEETKKPGKPFYAPVLSGLKFLTGWLQPLRYQYSEGFNRSIPGILVRLPWRNRLGLDSRAEYPAVGSNRNPSAGESESLDLGSGFTLFGGITTTVAYKAKTSRSLTAVGSDRTENITTSWPELSITIRRFTKLPLVKKYVNWFIDVFSPRTSYSRQISEVRNLDGGFAISRTETVNRSPVISLNLKLFSKLSLSGSYGTTLSIEERSNRSTGEPESEVRTTKNTVAVSTKYAFSSPTGLSIPLFGKLKFKSMVTIDLGVQYASNRSERSDRGRPYVPFTDNSNFSASPIISYTFSNQIKGGLTIRWQDTNDTQRHRKSHVREVQLWTEIRF